MRSLTALALVAALAGLGASCETPTSCADAPADAPLLERAVSALQRDSTFQSLPAILCGNPAGPERFWRDFEGRVRNGACLEAWTDAGQGSGPCAQASCEAACNRAREGFVDRCGVHLLEIAKARGSC